MGESKSFSERILDQDRLVRPQGPTDRVQHQKKVLAAFAVLRINRSLPVEANQRPFVSGEWVAACRFSNGQPVTFKDQAPDVRGIAIKFLVEDEEIDLLATNEGGRSHARDTAEFVEVSDILAAKTAGGSLDALKLAAADLIEGKLGLFEGARTTGILLKETALHRVESLTTEFYWGSVVELTGRPIKYSLQPHESTTAGTIADRDHPNFLREDLLNRLAQGPIRLNLCLQFFRDENTTPVNDASIVWDAPLVKVGELEIPAAPTAKDEVNINQMAFNPGNGFVPLGITKDRKEVYAASARNRGALSSDQVRLILRSRTQSASP